MYCGLNAKKNHCLISNIENLVPKIRSVKFSFLLRILISLHSAFWEIHCYSRRMCGPIKFPKLTPAARNRTWDLMIAKSMLYHIMSIVDKRSFLSSFNNANIHAISPMLYFVFYIPHIFLEQ